MSTRKATRVALLIISVFIVGIFAKPLPPNTPSLQRGMYRPRARRSAPANTERQWGGIIGAFGSGPPIPFGRYPPNQPAYGAWGSAHGSSRPFGGYPTYSSGYATGYNLGYAANYEGYSGFPDYSNFGNDDSYGGYYGGYRPYGGYAGRYPPSHGYYDGYYRKAASNK